MTHKLYIRRDELEIDKICSKLNFRNTLKGRWRQGIHQMIMGQLKPSLEWNIVARFLWEKCECYFSLQTRWIKDHYGPLILHQLQFDFKITLFENHSENMILKLKRLIIILLYMKRKWFQSQCSIWSIYYHSIVYGTSENGSDHKKYEDTLHQLDMIRLIHNFR